METLLLSSDPFFLPLILALSFIPSCIISPTFTSPPPLHLSRLHSNSLRCDCHLAWLSPWLRQRPSLGLYTQCSSPPTLRGLNLAELRKGDFACSGTAARRRSTHPGGCSRSQNGFFPSARRSRRQCVRPAVQPGVRLLSSHVLLQQQHRGLSGEGPNRHPRPPPGGHDRDVSSPTQVHLEKTFQLFQFTVSDTRSLSVSVSLATSLFLLHLSPPFYLHLSLSLSPPPSPSLYLPRSPSLPPLLQSSGAEWHQVGSSGCVHLLQEAASNVSHLLRTDEQIKISGALIHSHSFVSGVI